MSERFHAEKLHGTTRGRQKKPESFIFHRLCFDLACHDLEQFGGRPKLARRLLQLNASAAQLHQPPLPAVLLLAARQYGMTNRQ
jgi:hypothetical protein